MKPKIAPSAAPNCVDNPANLSRVGLWEWLDKLIHIHVRKLANKQRIAIQARIYRI